MEEKDNISVEEIKGLYALKVRLYPNKEQTTTLNKLFGCSRVVYNKLLSYKQAMYVSGTTISGITVSGITVGGSELSKYLHSELLKSDDYFYLKEFNSNILKYNINILINAYKRFYDKKSGYPNFKKKSNEQSVHFINPTCISRQNLDNGKLNLTKNIKNLNFRTSTLYRSYILKNKEYINHITITNNCDGTFEAAILFNSPNKLIKKNEITSTPKYTSTGYDLGIKTFITGSNGQVYENIHALKKHEEQLKRIQRKFSRTKKGSKNHEKLRIILAKKHKKITNIKENYIHNCTKQIINENQVIIIEDLDVKGMMKNHHLAKAIAEVSWSETVRQLEYKATKYGRTVVKVDRYFPSSKTCSHCGSKKTDLKLSDRTFICPECGFSLDRDLNAAININKEGLRILTNSRSVALQI